MSTEIPNDQMGAYSEAVTSGLYAKQSGLVGKYDNVRRLWEDENTRLVLQPYLKRQIDYCQSRMRRVRVMDLGCGSADGYELLTGVRHRDADLRDVEVALLTPNVLGLYKGVDLNDDLMEQARSIYGGDSKLTFEQADFTEGLPLGKEERPYDLYFASYGTWSHHNEDETLVRLLAEIAERTEDKCLIVCDLLGRYSYEWQTLWTNDLSIQRWHVDTIALGPDYFSVNNKYDGGAWRWDLRTGQPIKREGEPLQLWGPAHGCGAVVLTASGHALSATIGGLCMTDVNTGDLNWNTSGFASYACPHPIAANGRIFYAPQTSGMLFCFEPIR